MTREELIDQIKEKRTFLCWIGYGLWVPRLRRSGFEFNKVIIDAQVWLQTKHRFL